MPYGEKRRQQGFIVKYRFNYPSGKSWTEERNCYAYSEIGARDTIEWIFKGRDISIISITPTGKYVWDYIYPTNHVIGER